MKSNDKTILRVLRKEACEEVPFWFMRQAGRYLPEYKELRSKAKNFLDYCYTPDMATEATLQPIRRFDMSAAIIFSDILVIPHAMGMEVWFEEGKGPQLTPLKDVSDLKKLSLDSIQEKLIPVYTAIKQTSQALPKHTALIGFCGAPWTLACYAIEGKGSRDFQNVRIAAKRNPEFFDGVINLLTEAVILHAKNQINAGAEIIQLFDSWAGVTSAEEFETYVIAPAQKIVSELKKSYPHIPVIGFPRLAGARYVDYVKKVGADAVSVDYSHSPEWIKTALQPHVVVQGNLDNILLAENKSAMLAQAKAIIETLKGGPFIFNLGHGVLPHTPVEHVQALSELIKAA